MSSRVVYQSEKTFEISCIGFVFIISCAIDGNSLL